MSNTKAAEFSAILAIFVANLAMFSEVAVQPGTVTSSNWKSVPSK
jgi:hypothetical protein